MRNFGPVRNALNLATSGLALALGVSAAWGAPPPDKVALTGARVIPVVGVPLARGTVLVERGKIVAVGEKVEIPYDAREVDCSGQVIFPGMVHAHTARGLDIPNEPRPVVPHLDAGDALDPSQLFFEDCLRLGVTTVHVIPGNNTVIGGLGRVVRPIGLTVADMTVVPQSFMKISVSEKFDRIQQMAALREALAELDDYLAQLAEKRYEEQLKKDEKTLDVGPAEARKRGKDLIRAEDVEERYRNLLRLRGGQVRVDGQDGPTLFKPLGAFVYVDSGLDVGNATRVAKEYGFFDRVVFCVGGPAFKAMDELKAAARPIVLPPELMYRETNPLTGEVRETFLPRPYFDAGLKFALTPAAEDQYAERMLTYQAARCVREGIPRDVALRAITLTPAEMLGLADRVGSIEVGKDANLVVFSGDPLDFESVVERVFIDGILAYDRAKDVRLQRLLSEGLSDVKEKQPAPPGKTDKPEAKPDAGEPDADNGKEKPE